MQVLIDTRVILRSKLKAIPGIFPTIHLKTTLHIDISSIVVQRVPPQKSTSIQVPVRFPVPANTLSSTMHKMRILCAAEDPLAHRLAETRDIDQKGMMWLF